MAHTIKLACPHTGRGPYRKHIGPLCARRNPLTFFLFFLELTVVLVLSLSASPLSTSPEIPPPPSFLLHRLLQWPLSCYCVTNLLANNAIPRSNTRHNFTWTILTGKKLRAPAGKTLLYRKVFTEHGRITMRRHLSPTAYKMYLYGGTHDLLRPQHNGPRRP
jgi:hypothetical protein